ncbi:hypothetical protein NPIL_364231 [Nephila pilipes]|uniref:Uncharacterized protein n=1 Tax=Nephila pilipes TaxID=299642 RepID=A0A8X6JHE8_NEPPI|nr:hypothetical protein NPIL_364231 [Nephila pilipes]
MRRDARRARGAAMPGAAIATRRKCDVRQDGQDANRIGACYFQRMRRDATLSRTHVPHARYRHGKTHATHRRDSTHARIGRRARDTSASRRDARRRTHFCTRPHARDFIAPSARYRHRDRDEYTRRYRDDATMTATDKTASHQHARIARDAIGIVIAITSLRMRRTLRHARIIDRWTG